MEIEIHSFLRVRNISKIPKLGLRPLEEPLEEHFSNIPMGVQKASQHTGKSGEFAVPRVFLRKILRFFERLIRRGFVLCNLD
jgi:hypothetical protein